MSAPYLIVLYICMIVNFFCESSDVAAEDSILVTLEIGGKSYEVRVSTTKNYSVIDESKLFCDKHAFTFGIDFANINDCITPISERLHEAVDKHNSMSSSSRHLNDERPVPRFDKRSPPNKLQRKPPIKIIKAIHNEDTNKNPVSSSIKANDKI